MRPTSWDVPNRWLAMLRVVPSLRDVYANVGPIDCAADLDSVPPLGEAGYSAAMRHIYQHQFPTRGALLFMSSGSTGEPKIGFQPAHQHIPEIATVWAPLPVEGKRRLLIDFTGGGRAWSTNHFFRALALHRDYAYLHLGNIASHDELDAIWAKVIVSSGATAVSGTPTQLEFIASYFLQMKKTLPTVRSVLWTAEPLKRHHEEAIRSVFPEAAFWSVYGSTESWVIGYQTPQMERNEYCVLSYQHIEAYENRLLVTSLHEDVINPVLRYGLPDRINVVERDTQNGVRRMKIAGRADGKIFIEGNNLSPERILATVNSLEGVADAQLIFGRRNGAVQSLEIRIVRGNGSAVSPDAITKALLAADSENVILLNRLRITDHEPLIRTRTGKCPSQVFRDL
jgi:phenylacetate-coenzyme A ligase PaaK-like adenylate-forming protein